MNRIAIIAGLATHATNHERAAGGAAIACSTSLEVKVMPTVLQKAALVARWSVRHELGRRANPRNFGYESGFAIDSRRSRA